MFKNLKIWQLNILTGVLFLIFFNKAFWSEIVNIIQPQGVGDYVFLSSVFVLLIMVINLVLSLIIWQRSYKFVYFILFMAAASTVYFISEYNIVFDREMFRNVMETNASEAKDLMNFSFLFYFIVLGIIPGILIFKLRIERVPYTRFLISKIKSIIVSMAMMAIILYASYPTFASLARNNRTLSHLILPTNIIFAAVSYVKEQYKSAAIPHDPIAIGSKRSGSLADKKQVIILLIGETARADRFQLNGYSRETNPRLLKRDIANFDNTYSCGTSTATSLPCLFSHLGKEEYSHKIAKNTDNILDFLKTSGFQVQWRDNNTGCKGICQDEDFLDLTMVENNPHCGKDECFDEILFNDLFDKITSNPSSQVYVLHQKGSHGPAYYLRYPQEFEKFVPTCKDIQLQKCDRQGLNNSYDDTILYTDYIIDSAISLLQKLPEDTITSLVYISDHGESLGEKNLYLHGTPYMFAPDSQIHVPFLVWLSDSYQAISGTDYECLKNKKHEKLSHDNFFHSVLGLSGISTKYYDKDKDIFSSCRLEYEQGSE